MHRILDHELFYWIKISKYKVQISVQINMNINQIFFYSVTELLIGQKVDKGLMFKNRSWL